MLRSRTRPSIRLTGLLALALFVHVLVIFALAARLPEAGASSELPPSTGHAAHAAPAGLDTSNQVAFFDLTPPEVRSLGGPTLVEVLEAPPSLRVPAPLHDIEERLDPGVWRAPARLVDSVHAGRAPPVR